MIVKITSFATGPKYKTSKNIIENGTHIMTFLSRPVSFKVFRLKLKSNNVKNAPVSMSIKKSKDREVYIIRG